MRLLRSPLAFSVLAALTVAGLWLFTQPYAGLRHDGILYLAQALRVSRPTEFAQDLFFAHGSQDSLSLYSLIFGPLFAWADIWPTQPIVVLISHVALLSALWRLMPAGLSARERWLGMAAVALLRPSYGGLSIFGFCEPFLTGRTLAEPLALWALVAGRDGRTAWAWLLVVASAALHPLMALPVAATLWLMGVARDRRWLGLLLLGLPVAWLSWRGVAPFDALLRAYPAAWWNQVSEVNEQVLVNHWGAADWAAIATDVALVLGAQRLLYRRMAQSAPWIAPLLTACLVLLLLAIAGSQWSHNELITQLQLWRGLWLVRALSVALTPAVLLTIWRDGAFGPATAASIGVVLGLANLHWPTTWPAMAWPLLHLWIRWSARPVSRGVALLSLLGSALTLLAVGSADFVGILALPHDDTSYMGYSLGGVAMVSLAVPMLAFLAWIWGTLGRTPTQGPLLGSASSLATAAVALALVTTGAAQWDRRSPTTRYMEGHLHALHPFEEAMPPQAQVYWDDNLAAAWFIAKRPSYFTRTQGAGLLFNQGTADDFALRKKVFKPLIDRRGTCEALSLFLGHTPPGIAACDSLSEAEVTKICTAAPDLGYIVTAERFTKPPRVEWRVPGALGAKPYEYLYDCSNFR